jgi:transcription elongation factor GreB
MKPKMPSGPTRSASGSTTCYITPRGYKALADELDHLWKVERPKITQEVADAAAQGDRSENAEYIYGKKKLYQIDRRLRFLSKRMDELKVVQPEEEQEGRVCFGAYVTVEDEDEDVFCYQLVGPDEFDLKEGRVSVDSPMARALLGKVVGDEALVQRPKGETEYTIVQIEYEEE